MAAQAIVAIGGALLKIASKQLPKYLDKGAKLVKNPTKSQMQKAKTPGQKKKSDAIPKKKEKIPLRDKPKERSGKFDTRDAAEKAADLVEFEMDFGSDPDAEYSPRFGMDRFYASGGLVGGQKKLDKNKDGKISGADFKMMRKNYAYGGRVAKMSAEKS